MADIRPFKGLRYNSEKVNLEEVITEPYDRISPQKQEEYYKKNPYSVVRIILGKDDDPEYPEEDKYRRANIYLDKWLSEGILIREDRDALYLYEQEYQLDGGEKKRMGLIARVRLEEFCSRKVLPYERTLPKHEIDRLNLLRDTNTNTGQIFLLYKDDEREATNAIESAKEGAEFGAEVKDGDNFIHRLWIIKDQESIQRIQEAMADKVLIIADGHHRYETSLNFQKEILEERREITGDEPFNFIMMTLFRVDDPSLVILPTYRLVRGLDKLSEEGFRELFSSYFDISEVSWQDFSDKATVEDIQGNVYSEDHTFAAFVSQFEKFFIFKLKSEDILDTEIRDERSREWKRLDVAILHSLIIDKLQSLSSEPFSLENNVSYIRKLDQGLEKVIEGEFQMIFFLKPVSLNQVREVVENGELMPQKSTDFFPKLKSGLVMNPLT